jgi:SAM-dependent methyltransferase
MGPRPILTHREGAAGVGDGRPTVRPRDRVLGRFQFGGDREWVASRAVGEVLEVAIGTGRNLPFDPAGFRLVGVKLSPAMLAIAKQQASDLNRDVELHEGDAHALPFADDSFDTVVCTLSLCTVPDPAAARKCAARCGVVASVYCWITSEAPGRRSVGCSG